jgi:hypothetical protein
LFERRKCVEIRVLVGKRGRVRVGFAPPAIALTARLLAAMNVARLRTLYEYISGHLFDD